MCVLGAPSAFQKQFHLVVQAAGIAKPEFQPTRAWVGALRTRLVRAKHSAQFAGEVGGRVWARAGPGRMLGRKPITQDSNQAPRNRFEGMDLGGFQTPRLLRTCLDRSQRLPQRVRRVNGRRVPSWTSLVGRHSPQHHSLRRPPGHNIFPNDYVSLGSKTRLNVHKCTFWRGARFCGDSGWHDSPRPQTTVAAIPRRCSRPLSPSILRSVGGPSRASGRCRMA